MLDVIKQFTTSESILDPNDINNILIAGGGSLMKDFSISRRDTSKFKDSAVTIGEQIRMDLSEVLEQQGINGIEVKHSKDPKLCLL